MGNDGGEMTDLIRNVKQRWKRGTGLDTKNGERNEIKYELL
jgi:hypothetical protein